MLTKILFTILVILVVAVVFRHKNMTGAKENGATKQITHNKTDSGSEGIQARTIIYALLGLIVAISALLFTLNWQADHEIINIQVTDASGNQVNYQAYKMDIEGRRFTTLDGRKVTLGEGDRIEMTGTE